MYESEEAIARANVAKQAIRSRTGVLEAALFTGHGYEFTRTVGDETFKARKLKRGSKPADTVPTDERVDGLTEAGSIHAGAAEEAFADA